MAMLLFTSCEKQAKQSHVPDNALWRAPNGYVIPWSEHNNWQQYTAQAMTETKEIRKYYGSQACSTSEVRCGLECVRVDKKDADCSQESACAPCVACGCTPVTSPY
jgi:hypothetical protein